MKNVIECIRHCHSTIIQAEFGLNIWKGRVCHHSEGGGGRVGVKNGKWVR